MGDVLGLISTALGIISIATLAGLGLLRGTVVNLREQLVDARAELTVLKDSRTEDKRLLALQKSDMEALVRTVTGQVNWTAISDQLEEHHRQALQHWDRDETLLADMAATLRHGLGGIGGSR